MTTMTQPETLDAIAQNNMALTQLLVILLM